MGKSVCTLGVPCVKGQIKPRSWTDVMTWGGPLTSTVWLFFLVPPVVTLVQSHLYGWHTFIMLSLVLAIAGLYLWLVFRDTYSGARSADASHVRRSLITLLVMGGLSVAGPLIGGSDWLAFMIYTSAAAGSKLPSRLAYRAIGALVILTFLVSLAIRSPWLYIGQSVILVGVIGLITAGIVMLVSTIRELELAREERARLAVAEERLRLARDLHDLLGHSLSLIAVKSELAKHLVTHDADKARQEIEDIERVSRDALVDVRSTVSGYRQRTKAEELASATDMLTAADIDFQIHDSVDTIPPDVEHVLAWTIREGVTNVIRHSRASRCSISIKWISDQVQCEVRNDSRASSEETAHDTTHTPGNGLTGLSERVCDCAGKMDACRLSNGGFVLAVTLPIRQQNIS